VARLRVLAREVAAHLRLLTNPTLQRMWEFPLLAVPGNSKEYKCRVKRSKGQVKGSRVVLKGKASMEGTDLEVELVVRGLVEVLAGPSKTHITSKAAHKDTLATPRAPMMAVSTRTRPPGSSRDIGSE